MLGKEETKEGAARHLSEDDDVSVGWLLGSTAEGVKEIQKE